MTSRGTNHKKSDFNKAHDAVKSKDAAQCHYKWGHVSTFTLNIIEHCSYVLIFTRWFRSGTRNPAAVGMTITVSMHEPQVRNRYLKNGWRLPRYIDTTYFILIIILIQHTHLKPFAMKPWPFYRKMQNFMPGTQPQGTYSFDPSSSSAQSVLDKVNAEEDGAEDQDGPPLDLSHANITGAFFSSNLNILGFGALPSKPSLSHFSSSGGTRTPSLSSPPPTAHPGHPYSTQPCDLSMGSGLAFSHTDSDSGNTQHRKQKHDGQSAGGHMPSQH